MERIDRRTQNLATQMAAHHLSANEIKGACVLPSRPRPRADQQAGYISATSASHDLTCETQPVHTYGWKADSQVGRCCRGTGPQGGEPTFKPVDTDVKVVESDFPTTVRRR